MPPRKKAAPKVKFYTIQFEKYMEVVEDVNKAYNIFSDKIKDLVLSVPIENWVDSAIPDFFDAFILIDSYRVFLDEKVNNPSDEEIEFTVKYNIKDILFNKEELEVMQHFFLSVEARKEIILQNYGFSSSLN